MLLYCITILCFYAAFALPSCPEIWWIIPTECTVFESLWVFRLMLRAFQLKCEWKFLGSRYFTANLWWSEAGKNLNRILPLMSFSMLGVCTHFKKPSAPPLSIFQTIPPHLDIVIKFTLPVIDVVWISAQNVCATVNMRSLQCFFVFGCPRIALFEVLLFALMYSSHFIYCTALDPYYVRCCSNVDFSGFVKFIKPLHHK